LGCDYVHIAYQMRFLQRRQRVSAVQRQKLPREVSKRVVCSPAHTGTPQTGKGGRTLTGISLQNVGQLATQARLICAATSSAQAWRTACSQGIAWRWTCMMLEHRDCCSVSDRVPLLRLTRTLGDTPLLGILNGPRREASSMVWSQLDCVRTCSPGEWRCDATALRRAPQCVCCMVIPRCVIERAGRCSCCTAKRTPVYLGSLPTYTAVKSAYHHYHWVPQERGP
jgi:hypothetical protein